MKRGFSTVSLGGMGVVMSGGLYAHSAAYVLSMFKPTPHGTGCALGLPYLMNFNLPTSTTKLTRIATALGEQVLMHSKQDQAKLAVDAVVHLIRDVALPVTLREYGGIEEKDLEKMADRMIKLWHRPMNPRPMGGKESVKFWREMWEGI